MLICTPAILCSNCCLCTVFVCSHTFFQWLHWDWFKSYTLHSYSSCYRSCLHATNITLCIPIWQLTSPEHNNVLTLIFMLPFSLDNSSNIKTDPAVRNSLWLKSANSTCRKHQLQMPLPYSTLSAVIMQKSQIQLFIPLFITEKKFSL